MTSLEEGLAALVLSGGTLDNIGGGKRKKITTLLPAKAHTVSMTVFKKPLQRLLIRYHVLHCYHDDCNKHTAMRHQVLLPMATRQ